MSTVFSRPNLPDGKLPSTNPGLDGPEDYASWDDWDTADIVYAEVLQRNLAEIISKVNGSLANSDIDINNATLLVESTHISVPAEEAGPVWPTRGHRHDHDGVNSAALTNAVLTYTLIATTLYNIFRSPSQQYRGLLLHGRVASDLPEKGVITNAYDVAIPYNAARYGTLGNGMYRQTGAGGGCKFISSRIVHELSGLPLSQAIKLTYPYVYYTLDSTLVDSVSLRTQSIQWAVLDNDLTIDSEGILNWAVAALV